MVNNLRLALGKTLSLVLISTSRELLVLYVLPTWYQHFAILKSALWPIAGHIVHPHLARPLPKPTRICHRLDCSPILEVSAYNLRVQHVPSIIAHRAPLPPDKNLNSANECVVTCMNISMFLNTYDIWNICTDNYYFLKNHSSSSLLTEVSQAARKWERRETSAGPWQVLWCTVIRNFGWNQTGFS